MKTGLYNKIFLSAALAFGLASCTKDLNRTPIVGISGTTAYDNAADIKGILAKLYGGLTLSGQDPTAAYPTADIQSSDVGSNVYFRNWWEANELPTDEAKIAWNDGDLQQYNTMNWTPDMTYVVLWYNRIFYEVSLCNDFIRQLSPSKISSFSSSDASQIQSYVYEARFLRALAYYHAIDNFANPPFTTEKDVVGKTPPKQISRDSLFSYVESELLALQTLLPAPGANEYGRADQAAAWTLLAKLYLNASVYTGTDRSTDCITYCNKITAAGYTLANKYADLFLIDNHTTSASEIIFPLRANGVTSQSYGNSTFLIHAEVGGSDEDAKDSFGIASGGWAGLRATTNLYNLFPDPSGATDQRAMFFTKDQTKNIVNLQDFTQGYLMTKFRNISSTGAIGSDPTGNFADLDIPLFRLADVYLMYAEAVLRGGSGGDATTALGYVNAIRTRAYGGSTSGNIIASDLTLPFILDERGRELYWEGYRRTDLVRFGLFTSGSYLWPWKGNALNGSGLDSHYNIFPLSGTDLSVNPNLVQNPGYPNQ
jgi:starch-binding outer membrane protein, SusD/RagB family